MTNIIRLRNNTIKLTEYIGHKKYFNEIYCFILATLVLLFWNYDSMIGMVVMASLAAIIILMTNDLKYALPCIIYIIFILNHGFLADVIPYNILIALGVFALVLGIYTIRNGFHIHKMKSIIGLLGLAIFQIIPIFWNTTITNQSTLYLLYFADAAYLLIYIIVASGIKKNALELVSVAISYLGVIIAIECITRVIELKDTVDNVLSLRYHLGWGRENEAGIMLCFCLPFSFYLISKTPQARFMFMHNIKILLCIVGIILTNARGAYIFGLAEIIILYIATFFFAKAKFKYLQFIVLFVSLVFITVAIFGKEAIKLYDDILERVFYNNLNNNGRLELWLMALDRFHEKPLFTAFGAGMVADIGATDTPEGLQQGVIVYHSTIFETLAISGLFGFFFLLVHFAEKYRSLTYTNYNFMQIIGIGFLLVGLYGFIDNTYHMFYFMIPMVIVLATIDANSYEEFNKLF